MLLLLLVSFMGLTWILETMALVYESGNIIPRKKQNWDSASLCKFSE